MWLMFVLAGLFNTLKRKQMRGDENNRGEMRISRLVYVLKAVRKS